MTYEQRSSIKLRHNILLDIEELEGLQEYLINNMESARSDIAMGFCVSFPLSQNITAVICNYVQERINSLTDQLNNIP